MATITFLFEHCPQIAEQILLYLDLQSIITCFYVCKSFHNTMLLPSLWIRKLEDNSFTTDQIDRWKLYLTTNNVNHHMAVAKGMKNHLFSVLKSLSNFELAPFFRSLEPFTIAFHFKDEKLMSAIIQQTHLQSDRDYFIAVLKSVQDDKRRYSRRVIAPVCRLNYGVLGGASQQS